MGRSRLQRRRQRRGHRNARVSSRRREPGVDGRSVVFRTEFDFTLPCGYLDPEGTLHREVTLRRATAADEILPLKDPRVQGNSAYLIVILLSRVLTRLGSVDPITPK